MANTQSQFAHDCTQSRACAKYPLSASSFPKQTRHHSNQSKKAALKPNYCSRKISGKQKFIFYSVAISLVTKCQPVTVLACRILHA